MEDHNGPRTSPWILMEYIGTFLFFYVAFVGGYILYWNVLPTNYADQPWMLLLQRLLLLYIFTQLLVNWYLVRRHNAIYRLNEGVPAFIRDLQERGVNPRDVVRTALMWKYCRDCAKWVPPRSHHCKICNRCILKRDHHCYFTSTCIGFSNQRFFIVLLTYWIACIMYVPSLYGYLYAGQYDHQTTWTDLVLPITLYRTVFGSIPFVYANIVIFLWGSPVIWILAPSLLYDQIKELYKGLTPFELERGARLTPKSTRKELFREIFGEKWWLNFLCPMHFIYPSDCDGKNWKNHRNLEEHEKVAQNGHSHCHNGQCATKNE